MREQKLLGLVCFLQVRLRRSTLVHIHERALEFEHNDMQRHILGTHITFIAHTDPMIGLKRSK